MVCVRHRLTLDSFRGFFVPCFGKSTALQPTACLTRGSAGLPPPLHPVGFVAVDSKADCGCAAIPAPHSCHQAPQPVPCSYYYHTVASNANFGSALALNCVLVWLLSTLSSGVVARLSLARTGRLFGKALHSFCTWRAICHSATTCTSFSWVVIVD